MSKRILGSVLFASALLLLIAVATMAFLSSPTQAGMVTTQISGSSSGSSSKAQAPGSNALGGWSTVAPLPTVSIPPTPGSYPLRVKRANAAPYHPNGKIYLMGGRHGIDGEDTTLQWIWEYTPGDPGSWVRKNALMDGSQVGSRWTANMAVATLTDTNGVRVYAIGGTSIDSIPTPVVRVYDPVADSLTTLTSDPWPANPQRNPGGWAVYNNKLYIFGGFSSIGSGAVFSDTWVFDPMAASGSKWSQLAGANLSVARGYIGGAVLDGYLYAAGGDTWNGTALVPNSTVERLDLSQPSPTWTTVASLPTARGDIQAWAYNTGTGYEIAGKLVVAGGVYPVPDNMAYIYTPGTNSWAAFPSLINATRNYGAAQMNGYLYAFGGYDYSNNTPNGANWVQRYDATGPGPTVTQTGTGTPPTATNTVAATNTPTVSPTVCSSNYIYATATGTVVAGTTNIGSACDDCVTTVNIPFSFSLYGASYTSANASSNGNLQFVSTDTEYFNECLPYTSMGPTLFPHWDDLRTDGTGCTGGCGIFTSVSGSAPNRIFNIEWRTTYFSGGGTANFEVRLYENQATRAFEFIYGSLSGGGSGATVGVQGAQASQFTQYSCNTALANGLQINWTSIPCASPTHVSATPINTSTRTPSATATATATNTQQPPSHTPTSTPTLCPMNFSDVATSDWFYEYVRCLFCDGAISGYSDGTFRPYNDTTRGQMTKIVVIAFDYPSYTPPTPTFSDVDTDNPFYTYIETAAYNEIVTGYSDGTFRPFNNVTRGQLSKIVVVAAQWPLINPATPTFSDVPVENPFYTYIETAVCHQIITGYADGTFKPFNNATRAQIAKIVCLAVRNEVQCGSARVNIEEYVFVPQNITVVAGTTVHWTNLDEVVHTATSSTGAFDSGDLSQGQSFEFVFNTPGSYPYICTPHPWMTGTITVQ